jgi:uncharacterized protein
MASDAVSTLTSPSEGNDRHDILDVLRGLALFGIYFANIPAFSGYFDLMPDEKAAIYGTEFYDSFLLLFIDGRFYTIFSFLFGIGFALQLSRIAQDQSHLSRNRYFKRLSFLLILGLIHMYFIWLGDILALYAVLGFALYMVRGLSDRAVLLLAGIMLLTPIIGYGLFWALSIDPDLGLYETTSRILGGDGGLGPVFMALAENVRTTEWSTFFRLNMEVGTARIGYYFDTWRIPKVFAVMLIGLWAGRRLIDGKLFNDRQTLKRIIILGLVIGFPASLLYIYMNGLHSFSAHSTEGLIAVAAYTFAVFPTGFAYAAIIAVLWLTKPNWFIVFAPLGRMALSNYLFQSILSIAIFYGVGFNLGTTGIPFSLIVISISVVILQVVFSTIWLRHFRFGPMEWIWRSFTYGQTIKLKKAA